MRKCVNAKMRKLWNSSMLRLKAMQHTADEMDKMDLMDAHGQARAGRRNISGPFEKRPTSNI